MLSSSCSEKDCRVSPTSHTSEDLSLRSGPASSTRVRTEPTTASITGSDFQIGGKLVTAIPISFGALSEDPFPLKGCVLWKRRAFMVRVMASAKDKRRGRVWSREEQNSQRDAEAFG